MTNITHPVAREKIGVLLVNLGSPDAPTAQAVKPYLKQFLSDRRVVNLPALLWQPILRGIILRKRPAKSAALYQKIWLAQGSPLTVYSRSIQTSLQAWSEQYHLNWQVELGMTYGNPSISSALTHLIQGGVDRIILLPLFPQYSTTTTAAVEDAYNQAVKDLGCVIPMTLIKNYHEQDSHISALAHSVRDYWQQHGKTRHLVMSFHGTPEATRKKGDPYYHQCLVTGQLLANKLGLADGDFSLCFQSRFGYQPWLKPYATDRLKQLASEGHTHLHLICPGFAVDCLETLEEVALGFASTFKAGGGGELNYIPALNDSPQQINALGVLVKGVLG
ncbi:MAG: ferrochelatase [Gammaproteobacteria bacterium]|nr:ferrochelatase [Gammaproteobacteria bacterium]